MYRIHGTDAPWTIGTAVSKGCIRLYNQDVLDLYPRVNVGAKVTVTYQTFTTGPAGAPSVVSSLSKAPPKMPSSTFSIFGDDEPAKAPTRPAARAKSKSAAASKGAAVERSKAVPPEKPATDGSAAGAVVETAASPSAQ
jgi:hypothetical protein